jgi:undecaprenyl-diphosphatase
MVVEPTGASEDAANTAIRARTRVRPSPIASVIVACVGVIVAVLLGIVVHRMGNGPLAVDAWWHDLMMSWRTNAGLAVAFAFQFVGGALVMTLASIAIVVGLAIARRPWDALTVVVAMVLSQVVTSTLKLTFARPRPADSLGPHAMTSYPSGHATLAATLVVVLALILRSRLVWILALAWIVGMAWSRTYLAAHWLSDVIGGAILGSSIALLTWAIIQSLRQAVERQPPAPANGPQPPASGPPPTIPPTSPSAA